MSDRKQAKQIDPETAFSGFTRRASVIKTMMFGLSPDPRTRAHIERRGVLDNDAEIQREVGEAMSVVDICYRAVIDEGLRSLPAELDAAYYTELDAAYTALRDARGRSAADEAQVALDEIVLKGKEAVAKCFSDSALYKVSPAEMIKKVVPEMLEELGLYDELEQVAALKAASSYFKDYKDHRDRILEASDDRGTGTVADRILVDNAAILSLNWSRLQQYAEVYPEAVERARRDLACACNGNDLVDLYAPASWGLYARQEGIDAYNALLGGWTVEDGPSVEGLNQILSQAFDADPERMRHRPHLDRLQKQILTESETWSVRPSAYADDTDMAADIERMLSLADNVADTSTGDIAGLGEAVAHTFELLSDGGWVGAVTGSARAVGTLSAHLFGAPGAVYQADAACREELSGPYEGTAPGTKPASLIGSGTPVPEILELGAAYRLSCDSSGLASAARAAWMRLSLRRRDLEAALTKCSADSRLQDDSTALDAVRLFVEAVFEFRRLAGCIALDDGTDPFWRYAAPDGTAVCDLISDMVVMCNRVRNHLTKKPYDTSKMPVSFGRPMLGAGWDVNKTFDYGNIILERDGRTYFGILAGGREPNGKRIKIDKALLLPSEDGEWSRTCFKFISGAGKTLAKMFACEAAEERYGIPTEIWSGYKAKRYKDDPAFLSDLIDCIRAKLSQPAGWEHFDFRLKPTSAYSSWGEFCRDVDACGYTLWKDRISDESVQRMVETGQLYLFEVVNRDSAPGATRSKGLYTTLLHAAVNHGPDAQVRLLGGAEVFHREASLKEPVVHREGTYVVNRSYVEDGVRKPIPEHIHRELYEHANGRRATLSDEARAYEGKAVVKQCTHDIVKNRRFASEHWELHIGVQINNGAPGSSDLAAMADLNSDAVSRYAFDRDVPILTVVRGERRLAAAVLCDRDGNAIEYYDLDVIDGVDWHAKLNDIAAVRKDEQRTWHQRTKIKNLKDAYIQRIVGFVARIVAETGCAVAVEKVGGRFRQERSAVEQSVWAKLPEALVRKLGYLVIDRTADPCTPGSASNGYQLCGPWPGNSRLGSSTGNLIHVSPGYCTDVDLDTGYAPLGAYLLCAKSAKGMDLVLSTLRSLCFEGGRLVAELSWSDFTALGLKPAVAGPERVWKLEDSAVRAVRGKRSGGRVVYNQVRPSADLAAILDEAGIDHPDGEDLRERISAGLDRDGKVAVGRILSVMAHIDNVGDGGEGWLGTVCSPVRNASGSFYDADGWEVIFHKARAVAMRACMMCDAAYLDDKNRLKLYSPTNVEWLDNIASR